MLTTLEVTPFSASELKQENTGPDHVQIAPFALLRVAGLPYKTLTALRPPASAALIESLAGLYREQERHRPLLEDSLYEAVPRIMNAGARRCALKLRRDIHAGRVSAAESAHDEEVKAALPPQAHEAFSQWLARSRKISVCRQELDRALPVELSEYVRPQMEEIFVNPHFRRGIGIASPSLHEALSRSTKNSPDAFALSKTERSVLRYAIRASSKTTPFSTFMSVAHVRMRRTASGPQSPFIGEQYEYRATLNRGILARIYKEAFRLSASGSDVPFFLNETVRKMGPGRIKALLSQYSILNGRPWRHDRYSTLNLHASLVDILLDNKHGSSLGDLLQRIKSTGLDKEQAIGFLQKCIDRGLIHPTAAADAFVPDAPESFAARLAGVPGLNHICTNIRLMNACVHSVGENDTVFTESERRVRNLEQETLENLHPAKTFEPFQNVITEDCWLSGVRAQVEQPVQQLITQVGEFLKSQVALKDTYIYVRDLFLEQFGVDGVCRNAQEFLLEATNRVDAWRQTTSDRLLDNVVSRPCAGARVGLTAYVQPVDLYEHSGVSSKALVVNSVYEGIGWLAARFANHEEAEHRALAGSLRQWLEEAWPSAEPVEIPVSGECNGLQSHCPLTSRVLKWPGEPLLSGRNQVALDRLSIRYNSQTQFLDLFDEEERRIALVYLGAVLPTPYWGLPFLLTTLAQPCYFRRPRVNTPPLENETQDAVLRPRFTHNGLVLLRATWWVRISRIRDKWLVNKGAQRLIDTALDCQSLEIPAQFFARSHQSVDTDIGETPLDSRKPFWIDTRSPYCLTLLERMVEDGEWLVLTEVLPGTNGMFTEINKQPHISELHIEMMITV